MPHPSRTLGGALLFAFAAASLAAQGDDPSNPIQAAVGVGLGAFAPGATPFNAAGFSVAGPAPSCVPFPDPSDVWFSFTATLDGVAVASVCPASPLGPGASVTPAASSLAAFDGGLFPLGPDLACSLGSAACGAAEAEVQFVVVAGSTYLVRLGGLAGTPPSGTLLLAIIAGCPAPANDLPAAAITVVASPRGPSNVGLYTTACATGPTNVPGTSRDVWFQWTATCACYVTISAAPVGSSAGPTPVVGAFSGSPNATPTYGTGSVKVLVCPGELIFISVGDAGLGAGGFKLVLSFQFTEKWTSSGQGAAKREIGAGDPGGVYFAPLTLDFLHPGLPPAASFPNGWFYGVPLGLGELIQQLTWPGGVPFLGVLDATGYAVPVDLPPGTLSVVSGATIWSVALAVDPLLGIVVDVAEPNAFVIP